VQPEENSLQCPTCKASYPADAKFCRVDGTPLVAASTAAPPPATGQASSPAPGGAGQNRTAIIAAIAVVAVLAIVGIGYSLLRSRSPRASSEQRAADATTSRNGGQESATERPANPPSPPPRDEATSDPTKGRDDAQSGGGATGESRSVGDGAPAEQPKGEADRALERPPARRCTRAACFEIYAARLSPATARPGQTVRATARYIFQHNEGGGRPLQVEQSVDARIRSSRGESRRVDSGYGPNVFDLAFRVPDRADAGTYPVTLSVRRRSVTERLTLQLTVTR